MNIEFSELKSYTEVSALEFNMKLRNLIEEKNLTQKQVAKELNIASSTMGGYVQGKSEPDFDTLKKIAKYFDVTTDYLLDINDKKANNPLEDDILRIIRTLTNEQQLIYREQGRAFGRIKNTDKK